MDSVQDVLIIAFNAKNNSAQNAKQTIFHQMEDVYVFLNLLDIIILILKKDIVILSLIATDHTKQ
jgi:hypothetical protein